MVECPIVQVDPASEYSFCSVDDRATCIGTDDGDAGTEPGYGVLCLVSRRSPVTGGAWLGCVHSIRGEDHQAALSTLPFDGVSVRPKVEPLSRATVTAISARDDLAAMPAFENLSHNFLVMRMLDDDSSEHPPAYDFHDDALWATIAKTP